MCQRCESPSVLVPDHEPFTKQQTFDTVYRHLTAPGTRRCGVGSACMYRSTHSASTNGSEEQEAELVALNEGPLTACAIGMCIPDSIMDQIGDFGGWVPRLIYDYPTLMREVFDAETLADVEFLRSLQNIHDSLNCWTCGLFNTIGRRRLAALAVTHNLTIPTT